MACGHATHMDGSTPARAALSDVTLCKTLAPFKGPVRAGQQLRVKSEVQSAGFLCLLLQHHVRWDT